MWHAVMCVIGDLYGNCLPPGRRTATYGQRRRGALGTTGNDGEACPSLRDRLVHAGATEIAIGAGRISVVPPEAFCLVLRGAVAILPPAGGRRHVARVAGPGESSGPADRRDSCSSNDAAEGSTWIRALIASRLLQVDARAAARASVTDPLLARAMIEMLRRRAEDAERRLARTHRLSAQGRLHAELQDLAERFGMPRPIDPCESTWARPVDGRRISIPLTQELLADLTGGVRETVNRSLRWLIAGGLVERTGLTYTVFGPWEDRCDDSASPGEGGSVDRLGGVEAGVRRRRVGAVVGRS